MDAHLGGTRGVFVCVKINIYMSFDVLDRTPSYQQLCRDKIRLSSPGAGHPYDLRYHVFSLLAAAAWYLNIPGVDLPSGR